jgi:hypothetical protein
MGVRQPTLASGSAADDITWVLDNLEAGVAAWDARAVSEPLQSGASEDVLVEPPDEGDDQSPDGV